MKFYQIWSFTTLAVGIDFDLQSRFFTISLLLGFWQVSVEFAR